MKTPEPSSAATRAVRLAERHLVAGSAVAAAGEEEDVNHV
jgi:hypothetical protein